MTSETCNCPIHGRQGIGLVCTHVAHAIDRNEKIGFFWGETTDLARPDAWCSSCEANLLALKGQSSEQWLIDADFKIVCSACWDEAKIICGGFSK